MEGLTVGRIVHYVDLEGTHKAAVVAHVNDKEAGSANLMVFTAEPAIPASSPVCEPVFTVGYSEQPIGNTWHWIEKV